MPARAAERISVPFSTASPCAPWPCAKSGRPPPPPPTRPGWPSHRGIMGGRGILPSASLPTSGEIPGAFATSGHLDCAAPTPSGEPGHLRRALFESDSPEYLERGADTSASADTSATAARFVLRGYFLKDFAFATRPKSQNLPPRASRAGLVFLRISPLPQGQN